MKIKILLVVSILFSFLFAANVFAATFNVSTTAQFRKALEDAAVNGEDDTIVLEAGTYKTTDDSLGTFKFSDTEAHNLTIKAKDGLTATDVILDGASTHQVLNLTNTKDATYSIESLSITNGKSSDDGGGLYSSENIILNNCIVSNNTTSSNGGGIYVYSTITVTNSTISDNTASSYGGGIYGSTGIFLRNSTISGNTGTDDFHIATIVLMKQVHSLTVTLSGTGIGTVSAAGLTCSGKTCTGTYDSGPNIVLAASSLSCGIDCSKTFNMANVVTLTAIPESGSTFVDWSGACKGSSTTCDVTIDSDKVVSAAFRDSAVTNTYTITASAGKGGTIDQKGRVKVYQGMNVTFNITPNTGYEIADVKADGKSVKAELEGNYYTFTNVTGNHTIKATFKLKTISIAITAGSNGRITPSVSSIALGKTQLFTVTPNSGYVVDSVAIDGVKQDLAGKNITRGLKFPVTPDASASSVSIAATFRALKASDYLSAINIQPGNYQYSVKTCYKSTCVTPISFTTAKYYDANDLYDLFNQLNDSYDEGTCSLSASNLKATTKGFVYSKNWKCNIGMGLSIKGSLAFTFTKTQ